MSSRTAIAREICCYEMQLLKNPIFATGEFSKTDDLSLGAGRHGTDSASSHHAVARGAAEMLCGMISSKLCPFILDIKAHTKHLNR